MNIKLIFPPTVEYIYSFNTIFYNIPPYGLGILTAFLRGHGHSVEQEDLILKVNFCNKDNHYLIGKKRTEFNIIKLKNEELFLSLYGGKIKDRETISFIDKILDSTTIHGSDLVGFSILAFDQFPIALLLSKRIKERINIPIVFGGSFITRYGHLYPEVFNFVDYMIVDDGRVTLVKLIDYLQGKITISKIPNLIYKDNGKLITNPRVYYPLEDIPIPDFDGLPIELYKSSDSSDSILLPYQISSSCSNKCTFCTFYISDKLGFKSYDKIITELRRMKERYKSRNFYFCDNSINNSREYLEGLCDIFIKSKLDINWTVYAKVGNLDKNILNKMKRAGCQRLKFGVESGSDVMLKKMHKDFTVEQAAETLKYSHEAGIRNLIFLLPGYPYETNQDIKKTVQFIERNKEYIDQLLIYKFQLQSQSLLHAKPNDFGITNIIPKPCRWLLSYDESSGLKWNEKFKQGEYSERQLIRAAFMSGITFRKNKNFFIALIMYYLYILILRKNRLRLLLIRSTILNKCFVYLIPQSLKNALAYFVGFID